MPDEKTLRQQLRHYICDHLLNQPDYPLRDEESLLNGGLLDSFALADIVVFIEEQFGVYIPNEATDADTMDSVDLIVAQVHKWNGRDPH